MDYLSGSVNSLNVTAEEFFALLGNTTADGNSSDPFNTSLTSSTLSPETVFRNGYPSGYTITSIIIASVIVTILMIVIVVGNMLVIIAIATEKALKNIQNWFIASLAVADFFLGLVIMPFSLANELMGYWVFGSWWCDIHSAADVLLCTASIMNLCLISLDRYWSITQAVEYLKTRTPARAAFMITAVWIMSALICIPPLLGWKGKRPEGDLPQCKVSEIFSSVKLWLIACTSTALKLPATTFPLKRKHFSISNDNLSQNGRNSTQSESESKHDSSLFVNIVQYIYSRIIFVLLRPRTYNIVLCLLAGCVWASSSENVTWGWQKSFPSLCFHVLSPSTERGIFMRDSLLWQRISGGERNSKTHQNAFGRNESGNWQAKKKASPVEWSDVERLFDFTAVYQLAEDDEGREISIFLMTHRNYILFRMKGARTINHTRERFMRANNKVGVCVYTFTLIFFSFTSCKLVDFSSSRELLKETLLVSFFFVWQYTPKQQKKVSASRFTLCFQRERRIKSWNIAIYPKVIDMV